MESRMEEISNGLIQYFKDTKQEIQHVKILDLNEISAGWETELFSFKIQYSLNDKIKEDYLVIRMYPGDSAERKLTNELFIYDNLSKQNYPVPKIHYMSKDNQYVGKPFLIMDWIRGGILNDRMTSHPEETMGLFCQLFVNLHKLDWKLFIRDPNFEKGVTSSIDSYFDMYERRIKLNNLDELYPIVTWLKNERSRIKNEYLALGHFDFHPFNILLNENEDLFVIDWPAASVSDFRFDLGWTLVLFCVYTNRDNRDALFNAYQEIAGKKIEHIDFFEVAAILRRLSDILVIFKSDAESVGLHDGVTQMIKETIFHVENLNSYLEDLSGIRIKEIDELVAKIKNSD